LQSKKGGLVKVYDGELMPGVSVTIFLCFELIRINNFVYLQSKYKSLLISERTTVDELIKILLNCYNSKEQVEQFSLYEVITFKKTYPLCDQDVTPAININYN